MRTKHAGRQFSKAEELATTRSELKYLTTYDDTMKMMDRQSGLSSGSSKPQLLHQGQAPDAIGDLISLRSSVRQIPKLGLTYMVGMKAHSILK